jgi:hypothetical protein
MKGILSVKKSPDKTSLYHFEQTEVSDSASIPRYVLSVVRIGQ